MLDPMKIFDIRTFSEYEYSQGGYKNISKEAVLRGIKGAKILWYCKKFKAEFEY